MVHPRNATRLVRQHRLDGNPFVIGKFVAHNFEPQFGSLNHGVRPNATLLARPGAALSGRADIDLPSTPAKSVENDPKRASQLLRSGNHLIGLSRATKTRAGAPSAALNR